MSLNAQVVRTISFPTPELLAELQPLPEGIRGGVWDLVGDPEGVALEELDAVVLPYANGSSFLPSLRRVPGLKLVQTQSTGFDGVPEAVGEGVAVASAAGVHAAATAELAVGLVLASLRGMDAAIRDQQRGVWNSRRWPGLADRRILLVGAGGIGTEIMRRLEPFEVEITRVGSAARDDAFGHVHASGELAELAPRHAVLIAITPLNPSTYRLINAPVLAALPDGALVVNVARGAVVDSDALTAEVLSGRLRAALDVFDPEPMPADHPLWQAEGAIITPHIGGNTEAFGPRIVRLLRGQLEALAAGRMPANVVQPGPLG